LQCLCNAARKHPDNAPCVVVLRALRVFVCERYAFSSYGPPASSYGPSAVIFFGDGCTGSGAPSSVPSDIDAFPHTAQTHVCRPSTIRFLDYPVEDAEEDEDDEEDVIGRLLRRCWLAGMLRCTDR
jgi:hypothetical protein